MRIYKLQLVLLFVFAGMSSSFAQTMSDVNEFISNGEYEDAIEVLKVMDVFEPGKYTDLMSKVSSCESIQREARVLYQKEYYTKAIEKFSQIKRYFPSDRTVDFAIRQCEIKRDEYNRIQKLVQEQRRREEQVRQARSEEERQWQRAVSLNAQTGYLDYLNKYPVGKYRDTARSRLFDLYVNDAHKYYSSGNYSAAIKNFDTASRYGSLSLMSGRMYRLAKEKIAQKQESDRYEALQKGFTWAYQLEDFLDDYPNSQYATIVRGQLLDKYCQIGRFEDARRLVMDFPGEVALTKGNAPDVKWWMKNIRKRERIYQKEHNEVSPKFKGKDSSAFSEWVNRKLVYPKIAKENGVEGRVTVQFTVDKDGSVSDVKVLRGVDPSLDQEAVRVISMSPKWNPGKKDGKRVSVTYTFPVIFQLK